MPRALDDHIPGLLLFVHSAYSSPTGQWEVATGVRLLPWTDGNSLCGHNMLGLSNTCIVGGSRRAAAITEKVEKVCSSGQVLHMPTYRSESLLQLTKCCSTVWSLKVFYTFV